MFSDEAEAKFFKYIDIRDEDGGCWRWVGPATKNEYGMFRPAPGPNKTYAHRWSQERWNGPIPDGYQVDHLCGHPWCNNPEHLEPVTPWENMRRARGWVAVPGGYECKRGHLIAVGQECIPCARIVRRQWRARRKAEGNPERAAPKSAEQKRRDNDTRDERNRTRFLEKHPLLTEAELRRLGAHTCAQRFRRGWIFDAGQWTDSDGTTRVGADLPTAS